MNSFEAKLARSKHCPNEHLVIHLDGRPLDHLLAELDSQSDLEGLVSAIGGLEIEEDSAVVEERRAITHGRYPMPVLVCPDCVDFSCTVIIADVEFTTGTVLWHRVGLDRTPAELLPRGIGTSVDWYPGFGPFEFERQKYLSGIQALSQES